MKMLTSWSKLFCKVHFDKLFWTPKTNSKRISFYPDFVPNYISSFFNFAWIISQP